MNVNIDRAPILGEVPGLPGFYNCVSSNGYTLAPVLSRLTAEMLAGRSTSLPVEAVFDQAVWLTSSDDSCSSPALGRGGHAIDGRASDIMISSCNLLRFHPTSPPRREDEEAD